jgi:hypothetical protein
MLLLTDEKHCLLVCLMVFNATFNNISVIWWRSVLLVEETAVPGENHRPVASHWHILSHNVVHLALVEIRTHNLSGDRYWLHSWLFVVAAQARYTRLQNNQKNHACAATTKQPIENREQVRRSNYN